MNVYKVSSLESMTLSQIITKCFNKKDIINRISINFNRSDALKLIEDEIAKEVRDLVLPSSMKQKIISVTKPITDEIITWLKQSHYIIHLSNPDYVPASFVFNIRAVIDRNATALMLITDESLSIPTRYRIAAFYCVEQHVRAL